MPYRPTKDRLKQLNSPYKVKLVIEEREKTGWTFSLRWWNGKTQKRKSLKTQNFNGALKSRDRLEAGIITQNRTNALVNTNIRLSEFSALYLENCKARQQSQATIQTATWMLKSLVSYLDDIELNMVTTELLDNYSTFQLSRSRKPRGVVNDLKVFRTAFNWGIRQKWIDRNPITDLKFPRVPRQVPRRLSDKELGSLLTVIREDEKHSIEDRAITLVLALTGIRIGELLSLKWTTINLDERYFVIKGKGDNERINIIGSLLKEVLEGLMRFDETDLVFPGIRYHGTKAVIKGKKSYSPLRERFSKYFIKAGIETGKGTFHRLRHTVGSSLGEQGYSSLQISKVLGHSSEQTTKIYTSISESHVKEMIEVLNNKVRGIEIAANSSAQVDSVTN